MDQPDGNSIVATTARTTTILWLALMAGVALYAGVATYLSISQPIGPGAGGIPGILLWAAVAYLAASVVASPVVERAIASGGSPSNPEAIARAWQTEKIVGLAIRESAGLLGITVALLIGSGPWAILFGAATVIAMAMVRPSGEELARRISAAD
jgi:hypothetical protein